MAVKASLQFKHDVVVQQACHNALVLKHQLPCEKLRLRETVCDGIAQLGRFIHYVRAQSDLRLGIKSVPAHVGDVAIRLAL